MHKGSLMMAAAGAGALAATAMTEPPIDEETKSYLEQKKAEGWIDLTFGNRRMARARRAMARRRRPAGRKRH